MRPFLLAAGLVLGPAALGFAEPAVTIAPSTMHRAADPNSRIVQEIPANAQIDLSNCAGDWCQASWRHVYGYIPAFAVESAGPPGGVEPPPSPFVVATPPVVMAPAFGWGGPYVGFGWGWRRW